MGNTINLTKKHALWVGILVLLVCAIAFGVAFSATPLTMAKADGLTELPIVAVVQGTIGGTDAQYPNLISGSAHQVVVRYYLAMPEGYSAAGAGQFAAYVLPKAECTMVVSGNDLPAYAPASIAANSQLTAVGVNVSDYNSGDSELIEITGEFDFADVVGATSSNNAWTVTNASNYLFEATYTIPADAPSGTYSIVFGVDEGESVSFGLPDETPVELAPMEKSGVAFNVYNTVALPETNDFVYDGASHLGGLEETADYTVTGDAQTNAGEDYTAVVSLKNFAIWDLGNGSYSTEAQTLYWDITKRPVTLSFSAGAYSSTYGEYDEEEIAEAVGAIANAGTVVAADGILQADLASFAIGWDVTAGEYNSESFDVTHAGTGAAYLETANTGVYTLSIGYTANANYDVTVAGTATYTITVATPILEITEPDEDGTELRKYTGAAVTIGTSAAEILYEYVSDAGAQVTVTWFDNVDNVIEAPVVVGNYKVRVALGATRNYTAASEERTFSIGKQNQTVTLTPHNRVFNGLAATIGVGDSYDIEVATNATSGASASYSHNGAILHANTYQDIAVTIPGDANYNEWNGTTSLVISPIAANFSISLQNETYKGTAYAGSELTVTSVSFAQNADLTAYLANVSSDYDAFNAVSNFSFSLTPDGVLAAGTHTDAVAVSISGINNFANAIYGDFTFTGANATVTIDKANLTIDIYSILDNGDVVKQYDAQAVTDGYNDADNYDIAYYAYITGSSWGVEASRFDAPTNSFTVKYYNNEAGAPAGEIDAPSLPGTYWIVVTLDNATANFNANTVGAARQFVIEPSTVYVKLSYVYGANVKYLEYVNNALTYVNEETISVMQAGRPMPAAATLNFFRTTGFVYDVVPFVEGNSQENPIEITATYTFDVGAGDLNGDKKVTSDDAITLRRILARHIAVKNVAIRTEVNAWTDLATLDAEDLAAVGTIIFKKGADVIADEKINAVDVAATLEAFATGYGYAIVSDTDISGKKIKAIEEVTVYDYEQLVSYVEMGYPVKLGADISAATRDFNPTFSGSVSIKMNGKRLTVNSFTLSTNEADVTLKVFNAAEAPGIIYSVDDIRISAPNGNVKVADVNGYTYEGNEVILEAYTSSLHIEEDVAFYVYRVDQYGADAAAFAASITTDEAVDSIASANITNTDQLIADKVTKEGEKAALEAEKQALIDEGADEEAINAKVDEINAKGAEITNLEVKKAPVSIPVDTHVVVEEGASLKVEQINVVAAKDATVSTFSIEVKNADAEEVKVDISAVKSQEVTGTEVTYTYHVNEVARAGEADKVKVVSGENTSAAITTYVAQIGDTGYATLQAAIDAAANGDTIKLTSNVTNGTGITLVDGTKKDITIDFNGKTYTVVGPGVGSTGTETQAMHWGSGSVVTLKNGTFVITTEAATVVKNGKTIKMAMQNYAALTVKDMTMDFSNLVVQNYGNYANNAKYKEYSFLEIPLFNLNEGTMLIEDSTITMPAASTKGILIEIPAAATIKNSEINGYVSLGHEGEVALVGTTTVTDVVPYFANDTVVSEDNYYSTIDGVAVRNATELQAALDAAAPIINVMNSFAAPNPIAIKYDVVINGNDSTITSSGNRIINVTMPNLDITINDITLLANTSFTERGLNIWDTATGTDITLNNVYIDAHLYAINYVNGADDSMLRVNDSYLKGWGAINAHFNDSACVVTNSTLYGINRTSDHTYGFSTITIDGDSLNGAQAGDHGVNNTFVFDGCTIIAEVRDTHQYWISFQYAASGNTASVVVNNCEILDAVNGDDKTYDMLINGTNNAVVLALNADQYAAIAAQHYTIVNNNDGTYTVSAKVTNIDYFGTAYNFYDVFEKGWLEDTEAFTLTDDVVLDTDVVFARNRAAAIAVSGGSFEMNLDGYSISGEGKILLPAGVTCVTDSTTSIAGLFEAPEGEVLIESVDADGNYIYAVGVAYVKTKAEFTAAVTAGAKKLVICADINLSMYTYNRDMDITIDLNGHTLTTTMTGITFSAARTLNIVDSSANGTGAINSTGNYAINMGTASTADTVINVYGGTLTGKTSAAIKVNDGTLNVYGGTLTCPAAGKYAVLNYQGYAGNVNIYGGTFTAAVAVANNGTGSVAISGGTFSADPSDFVASGYMAVEDEGIWTVEINEIEITTFAELAQAIAAVNEGTSVNPTLIIMNDIAFEYELEINKSVSIIGDGTTKFIGYNATGSYNDAFFISTSAADQTVTIQGIVFDHFSYYSNVANKTKGNKEGTSVITYSGACHSGTTLNIIECEVIGTGRDMINASSSLGCAGTINITDCTFDATDRITGTLNMLSFYGKEAADLYVTIENCIFSEATEGNADWATTAIASFGNAVITVDGCIFEDCQVAIGIDNTFDRLYSSVTYPVYVNTICTLNDVTYVNCYFGYYEESIVASVADIPEGYELAGETASALSGNQNAAYGNYYEYDYAEDGTQGVDAKYLVVSSKYIAA